MPSGQERVRPPRGRMTQSRRNLEKCGEFRWNPVPCRPKCPEGPSPRNSENPGLASNLFMQDGERQLLGAMVRPGRQIADGVGPADRAAWRYLQNLQHSLDISGVLRKISGQAGVKFLEFKFPPPERTVGCVRLRDRLPIAGTPAFVDTLKRLPAGMSA
jgi:hypothetical protein